MQQFDIVLGDTEFIEIAEEAIIHKVTHLRELHLSIEVIHITRAGWRRCDSNEVFSPLIDFEI